MVLRLVNRSKNVAILQPNSSNHSAWKSTQMRLKPALSSTNTKLDTWWEALATQINYTKIFSLPLFGRLKTLLIPSYIGIIQLERFIFLSWATGSLFRCGIGPKILTILVGIFSSIELHLVDIVHPMMFFFEHRNPNGHPHGLLIKTRRWKHGDPLIHTVQ